MQAVYSNLRSLGWIHSVSSQFTHLQSVPDQVNFVQWKRITQEDTEERL